MREVTIKTVSFGDVNQRFSYDGTILSLLDVNRDIDLKLLIKTDTIRFNKLNKANDDKHQIMIDTLVVDSVKFVEGAQMSIRITYTAETSNVRRYCLGDIGYVEKGCDDKLFAYATPSGCCW